jgi:hypothetical protein
MGTFGATSALPHKVGPAHETDELCGPCKKFVLTVLLMTNSNDAALIRRDRCTGTFTTLLRHEEDLIKGFESSTSRERASSGSLVRAVFRVQ